MNITCILCAFRRDKDSIAQLTIEHTIALPPRGNRLLFPVKMISPSGLRNPRVRPVVKRARLFHTNTTTYRTVTR